MSELVEAVLTTTVKKAGGSLMLTVPAAVRDALNLAEGQELVVTVDDGRLVYQPKRRVRQRSKYTIEELVAQCDFSQPYTEEELAWLNEPPVGREIL